MKSSMHVTPDSAPEAPADGASRREGRAMDLEPDAVLEPVRLLSGGGSGFEQRLLGSARVDHMPHASRQRLAQALNVRGAARGRGLGGLLRAVPSGGYGSLAGLGALALIAAWAFLRPPAPAEPARAPAALVAPSPSETGRAGPLTSSPAESAAPAIGTDPSRTMASSPDVPRSDPPARPRARPRAAPATPTAARAGLREELRALETVQSAVRAGRWREARAGLDDYGRRFPSGELGLEAELLALDVSLARGERRYTRDRARELLASPGAARYRARLEALSRAAGAAVDTARVGSDSRGLPHEKAEATE